MAEEDIQIINPRILGSIILGKEVLTVIGNKIEEMYSITLDIVDLHSTIKEKVLKKEVVKLIIGKKGRRKGIDRRQQILKVDVDKRDGAERRIDERRSEFERRIQQLEVSVDRRTYDRRRAWVD